MTENSEDWRKENIIADTRILYGKARELRKKWDELIKTAEELYQTYVKHLEANDVDETREEKILRDIVAILNQARGEVYLLESLMKMKYEKLRW